MDSPVIIKKYPNRRLYDTASSKYVTLDDVAGMIRNGKHIEVIDLKTNQDVTAFVLTQILMEQAKKNHRLLPVSLLHLIIGSEENDMAEFFEKYLELSIRNYLTYKRSMEDQFKIFMELGMDMSAKTRDALAKMSPFQVFSNDDNSDGKK